MTENETVISVPGATIASSEKPKLEQKVSVEEVGPARKALVIEIPESRIAAKIKDNMGKLQSDSVLPGFRRGRAPARLLEKRFGQSVREDVRGQLISESYAQAIEELKLEVLGEPEAKDLDKLQLPDTGPLTVRLEVEVVPAFELPADEGIEVKKPKLEVGDAQVQEEIKGLQRRFGRMNPVTDGGAAADDFLQVDARVLTGLDAKDDAPVLLQQPNIYVLVTGEAQQFKGQVLGIAIDDLGKTLAGKKTGEEVRLSVQGPASHEIEALANQPLTIVLKINQVTRIDPAPLEALAAQMGAAKPEELPTRIKEMLESRRERSQRQALHQQLAFHLLEKTPMDLPSNLSKRQTARILHRQAMDMAMRGVAETEIEQKIAEMRAGSEQQAARQLKLFFILDSFSRKYNIEVSENEINSAIYSIAMQQGRRPEKMRQQMQRTGQIEQLFLEIRDGKTLDKMLEKAQVVEVDKLDPPTL